MEAARTPRIRVLVADAHLLVADALAIALGHHPDLEVLAERPTTGPAAVDALTARQPDIALLDYDLEGMEGPAVVHTIRPQAPATMVMHLAGSFGHEEVARSRAWGAVGFLPKSLSVGAVAAAVRAAWAGQIPVFVEQLEDVVATATRDHQDLAARVERVARLTPRQVEVLRLLSTGRTVEMIAGELGISTATVRRHVHHILTKTQSRSQLEAVTLARQAGFLP